MKKYTFVWIDDNKESGLIGLHTKTKLEEHPEVLQTENYYYVWQNATQMYKRVDKIEGITITEL